MRALVCNTFPSEGSARIGDRIGHHCEHEHVCYLTLDAHSPALDSFDPLVVMAADERPRSAISPIGGGEAFDPRRWMPARRSLASRPRQLLAQALGAAVRLDARRNGWWPLHRYSQALGSLASACRTAMAFHWHGETFDLPAGGVPLSWFGCLRQPGVHLDEQAIGLQCHLESTREIASRRCSIPAPQDLQREGA